MEFLFNSSNYGSMILTTLNRFNWTNSNLWDCLKARRKMHDMKKGMNFSIRGIIKMRILIFDQGQSWIGGEISFSLPVSNLLGSSIPATLLVYMKRPPEKSLPDHYRFYTTPHQCIVVSSVQFLEHALDICHVFRRDRESVLLRDIWIDPAHRLRVVRN